MQLFKCDVMEFCLRVSWAGSSETLPIPHKTTRNNGSTQMCIREGRKMFYTFTTYVFGCWADRHRHPPPPSLEDDDGSTWFIVMKNSEEGQQRDEETTKLEQNYFNKRGKMKSFSPASKTSKVVKQEVEHAKGLQVSSLLSLLKRECVDYPYGNGINFSHETTSWIRRYLPPASLKEKSVYRLLFARRIRFVSSRELWKECRISNVLCMSCV